MTNTKDITTKAALETAKLVQNELERIAADLSVMDSPWAGMVLKNAKALDDVIVLLHVMMMREK